jgi:hypothetical protein
MYLGEVAACHKPYAGLRGDDVETRLTRMMQATVEKNRPRHIRDALENFGAVGTVRELSEQRRVHRDTGFLASSSASIDVVVRKQRRCGSIFLRA